MGCSETAMTEPKYAELWAASNFSFLRGASHPWELVVTAKALGLAALGLADRNTLAGVVRAWAKGREIGQRVVAGARLVFADETPQVICYPADREAWGRLTRLLTVGQRRAAKGDCRLSWRDLLDHGAGQLLLILPPARASAAFEADLRRLGEAFEGRAWLAASRAFAAQDLKRLHRLEALGAAAGTPMIATGDALYHAPERRILQDVVTCIREGVSIEAAGLALAANAERHLKSPAEMARLFAPWPAAVARTLEVAGRIDFDLSQLRYEYPDEPVPPGKTAIAHLTDLAWAGAAWRYPRGIPNKVRRFLKEELALIEELNYPNYFLTVHDIVRWARDQGILCQGRGSAANSAVCFCLGVTAVDPTAPKHDILFARFISRERDEPPDIDVDFEHERRELVMQYIYERYGRERAAICATVIHYRSRMAIREVGKALGLTEDVTAALANTVWSSWGEGLPEDHIRQAGLDPLAPEIVRATTLAAQLKGFPRHLSQHVGGFVLTKRRLDETVPIGNGAMKDRTFIEWDKDDIDALGLMKVDVLALGMLSAIKKAMEMIGVADLADVPGDDPAVYRMLSRADSVGVFQVESRAQMSMLPRMRPREFYDLVIEVAIVRPGPIQGDMVHPYLRRREGREAVEFPAPAPEHGPPDELVKVLGKTLGVPLFQEQAMRLAIEAAKFSPEEANGLRRAMATFKHDGDVGVYGEKFVAGMVARGYEPTFAQRCFRQIEGFGSYGFPESHAVSFAKLVWVSAWIKHHRPDVFCAALINSQPMGFYQPAQLVRDAREHGVEVRPVDILASDWDCTLEAGEGPLRPVRLGLRLIKGLQKAEADRLIAARAGGLKEVGALARAAQLSAGALELLAEADALTGAGLGRREGLWAVKGMAAAARSEAEAPLLALMGAPAEAAVSLAPMSLGAHVAEDYRTTQLSLKAHPCAFFRPLLASRGAVQARALARIADGRAVSVGGLVLIRQRPGTAKGVVFVTLEDETGSANAVIWPDVFAANRRTVMSASFLIVHGRLQRAGEVIHVVAERFEDLSGRIAELEHKGVGKDGGSARPRLMRSRDFH
jgi:error-prone DNA polymerase